jgi:serine/threonine protein kinase/Flp pilus assembly protein TadD
MDAARWEQIKELYHAALERPAAERAAWLSTACAGDEELRCEASALLAAHAQAPDFLAVPARELVAKAMAPEPASALLLRQLAHYEILAPLGAGGMGEVWQAYDMQLKRQVALKLLPARFTTDAERVRRFELEAHATSALNHPNIITIHEIGEVENTHFIVTEYVAGETLRQRMMDAPQQRMTASEAIDLAVQIAAALAAAHEAGITHRDIKPENVMVRRDGIVKVLDFGLAKLTEEGQGDKGTRGQGENSLVSLSPPPPLSSIGVVMGTPRYMSPEQARGEKVDVRTDLFSLGVMLYEMIAGCAPFADATANETIAAILRDEALPLTHHAPAAPIELERIVSQALRKERADRYQTAGALLADLKELKQRLELAAKLGTVLPPASGSQNIPPEGGTTNKDLILLADFENKTGDAVFDGTLRQGLAIQLRQSPFLSLFPEERVRHTLRLMRRSPEERVTARIAQEICLRHNLKALIAGSIAPLGSHYVITLEALHGQTGFTLETEQVEAKSKERVLRALSQAASRLRAKLGESLSSIQQFDKEMEETTTEKLEAFQAYSLGYEQTLSGRLMDAIQLYRRAVELDPDFSYAWSMLAIHHSVIGRPGLAAEYAEKAYALKDRVSDYEQLQVTFRYHYNFTGDMHKALDAAILFKRIYPRTSTAPIDLLVAYDLLGRHDLAVAEGREAVRLNPNFAPAYFYLGRSLLRANRFAEAKAIFQQALDQKFDLPNIHAALYQIACAEGDAAGMQQQLNWAQGRPDEFVALDWQAGAAACAGQWRKAREFARRAIDLTGRGDTKELAARYAVEQALRGAVLEDCQQAQADAAQGLQLASGRASLPRAALALALCGEAQQVTLLLDELSNRYPEDTVINSIWLPTIRAALELQGGNAAQAIDQLQTTRSYEAAAEFWPQHLRGLAYLKLGRGTESAAEFQKILGRRGHAPLSPLYPLAHLGLARATALTDDLARSRQAYEDFFAAWKDADADLPILRAAKRESER